MRPNRFAVRPEVLAALGGELMGYYVDDDLDTVRVTLPLDDTFIVVDLPVEVLTDEGRAS